MIFDTDYRGSCWVFQETCTVHPDLDYVDVLELGQLISRSYEFQKISVTPELNGVYEKPIQGKFILCPFPKTVVATRDVVSFCRSVIHPLRNCPNRPKSDSDIIDGLFCYKRDRRENETLCGDGKPIRPSKNETSLTSNLQINMVNSAQKCVMISLSRLCLPTIFPSSNKKSSTGIPSVGFSSCKNNSLGSSLVAIGSQKTNRITGYFCSPQSLHCNRPTTEDTGNHPTTELFRTLAPD